MVRTLILSILVLSAVCAKAEEPSMEAIAPAVEKGLEFLAKQQHKDGSWGKINTVAMTAGSCMALMASGSTYDRGPYSSHIRAALSYLLKCQESHGCILDRNSMSWAETHSHGYALLCLAQMYGMVPDEPREKIADAIRKAIKASVGSQSDNGGWGYGVMQKNALNGYKDEGSCSITQLQALRACQDIHFEVPRKCIEAGIKYVEKCQHSSGGFLYSLDQRTVGIDPANGTIPTYAVSAAMMSSLNAAGDYHSPLEKKGLDYLKSFVQGKRPINIFFYYGNFYASQAFYQAGENEWQSYWTLMAPLIVKKQRVDGSFPGEGTWESDEQYGSPILTTAFALLVLQIPNGYLPIFQR
jgi:hypothetical protein